MVINSKISTFSANSIDILCSGLIDCMKKIKKLEEIEVYKL